MANNSSNSNFVSIQSLPQAQIALDTDLLILQTQNGTQTITFDNFNVVKTDINGNVVLPAALTGNESIFATVQSQVVSGAAFYSEGIPGTNRVNNYANRLEITNGITTSASYAIGSPEYVSLYNLIQSVSAIGNIYERWGFATINGGLSSQLIYLTDIPSDVGTNVKPHHFNLQPAGLGGPINIVSNRPALSTVPVIDNLTYNSSFRTLTFVVNAKQVQNDVNYIYWRLLYFYGFSDAPAN